MARLVILYVTGLTEQHMQGKYNDNNNMNPTGWRGGRTMGWLLRHWVKRREIYMSGDRENRLK